MKIAVPPRTTNTEGNLTKQFNVFRLCYEPTRDHVIHTPMDCYEMLNEVHYSALLERAFVHGQNGFSSIDNRIVAHAQASVSAFVGATSAAINRSADGKAIAFAPVSGFHHAGPNRMGGFCTFNGLVIAALMAVTQFPKQVQRVLILDGDGHFGDGTDECIDELDLHSTITNAWIADKEKPMGYGAIERLIQSHDLVLYQAGADAHIDDPYGAGHLTTGEWITRDRKIFKMCKDAAVPIVWNLAGGYNGAKTLDLHTSTFESAVEVFYDGQQRSIARGATVLEETEALDPDWAWHEAQGLQHDGQDPS